MNIQLSLTQNAIITYFQPTTLPAIPKAKIANYFELAYRIGLQHIHWAKSLWLEYRLV